jgi:DNA invertase Pin-like site-specific DNA recombinase
MAAETAGYVGRRGLMARWRVDYLGKKGSHHGSVEAPDERGAVEQAAKQFNITPARRNKIVVTRTQAAEKLTPGQGGDRPMTKPRTYVAYFRVSTDKQGKSGLGLEAQQAAVAAHVAAGDLIASYTEIESGKRNDRPELAKAIAHCKAAKATLIVAKLDRLARNVHFISGLMESKVDFIAADMPTANRLTIHVLAAVAEHEREAISARTKAALAAAKARGVKLGYLPTAKANADDAKVRAAQLRPVLADLQGQGLSLRKVADTLNAQGVPTVNGGRWHLRSVQRVLDRLDAAA